MSSTWKQALLRFLKNKNDGELKNTLRKEWIDLFPEDKAQIYQFLFVSGQHQTFTSLFLFDLSSHAVDLPWYHMLLIFKQNKVKIPQDFFNELHKRLHQQQVISRKAESLEELIQRIQEKSTYQFLQKVVQQKQELMASVRIAESEQLYEQQIHYLKELKKISPKDYNVTGLVNRRQLQKAEQVLSRKRSPQKTIEIHENNELDPLHQELLRHLKKQIDSQKLGNERQAMDFAHMFRSFGDWDTALDFIYKTPANSQRDWHLLDFLLSGKQYLALLDHCNYMKINYGGHPDNAFSISYAEALAYWHLGEKPKAIDLMEQISTMRPEFKSASEMLMRWREEYIE